MPQLAKGGKYVFGWSVVSERGEIVVPPEALKEYGLGTETDVIIMSGSRTSGGFSLISFSSLAKSPLSTILNSIPEIQQKKVGKGEKRILDGRVFCWTQLNPSGIIELPLDTLSSYDISPRKRLLVIRGSGLGVGFALRGPIVELAKSHTEIQVF